MGLSQVFKDCRDTSAESMTEKHSLYEAIDLGSQSSFHRRSSRDASLEELKAQDIFDLGHILLVAATGGLELLNQDSLQVTPTEEDDDFLHAVLRTEASDPDCYIKLADLLSEARIDKQFLDLICKCMRFDPTDRSSAPALLSHPWIR